VSGRQDDRVALHTTVRRRAPADLSRLLWFTLVLVVGLGAATVAEETMAGAESDIIEAFVEIPASVVGLIEAVIAVLYLTVWFGAPILLAVTRRWRTLGLGFVGIVTTSLLFSGLVDALPARDLTLSESTSTAFTGTDSGIMSVSLATYTTALVIAGHEVSRRWQRALWVLLGVLALLRILTAGDLPLDVVLAVGVGGVVGTLLLLAVGRSVRVWSAAGVRVALERGGLEVREMQPLDRTAFGAWEHRADTDRGPVLAKVVGTESQQLDTLYRAYRRVRLRDVGDDSAYSSARRAVAVESLLSVYSASHGVRCPQVLAISPLGGDDVVLAVAEPSGTALSEVADEQLTDDVLGQCWELVVGLRRAQVAHRALELGSFVLDDHDHLWLINFDFGQPAAEDHVLAGDVAELLAATYVRVGAERAVAAAAAALGPGPLSDALGRIVPAALTPRTRSDLKEADGGAEPLVAELCRVTGIEEPTPAKVERLKPRYLVIGALMGVAVYFLLPQLSDMPSMIEAVRTADWRWVPPAVVASAVTYVGVGMAMAGATPGRASLTELTGVQLASSFVATFAPPGLGQLGLNLRYLQKRGFAGPLAVSVIASKETVVFVVHIMMLGIVGVWAGRSGALDEELDKLPSGPSVLIGAAAVLVVVGLATAFRRVRLLIREKVLPALRTSVTAMAEVLRSPVKMVMLFSGITLLSVGYAACLYFSLQAFGAGASYPAVALVYLTAGTVASAAPTPGGLGAVEAILVAALTGIGIDSSEALAGVFLYRLCTFWLPILPGFLAFRSLSNRHAI
jgi:undecaprenyl-diphosphatase